MKYTESKLEQSFIELLQAEGYTYVSGQDIVRKNNQEVLIREDLAAFNCSSIQRSWANRNFSDLFRVN